MADICVVLVEPQGPRNIGSVCRAMQNFDISELRLIRPCAEYLGAEARQMAVRAVHVLEQAKVYDDLAAALADTHLVFGTTRRYGKYREDCLVPSEAAGLFQSLMEGERTALVFGREDSGLTTSELDFCNQLLTIPTSETLPSMNLSHAVTICLYELFKGQEGFSAPATQGNNLAPSGEVEEMFSHMGRTLLEIGYSDPQNPDHILRSFRRLLGRGGMSERDVRILQGLWSRIDWLQGERRKAQGKG